MFINIYIILYIIFIIRYLNVVPSMLNQAVLKNNTKYHKIWSCSGSWVANAHPKHSLLNDHNFQRSHHAFYSSAMLMSCNNPLKENLLTYIQFISNISFLCPQGWAVIRQKNILFSFLSQTSFKLSRPWLPAHPPLFQMLPWRTAQAVTRQPWGRGLSWLRA